jgi:hypothetical protein
LAHAVQKLLDLVKPEGFSIPDGLDKNADSNDE